MKKYLLLELARGIPTDSPCTMERHVAWNGFHQLADGRHIKPFHSPLARDFPELEIAPGARFVVGRKVEIPAAQCMADAVSSALFVDLFHARREALGPEGLRPLLVSEAIDMRSPDAPARVDKLREFCRGGQLPRHNFSRIEELLDGQPPERKGSWAIPIPLALLELANVARGLCIAPELAAQVIHDELASLQTARVEGSEVPIAFAVLLDACRQAADGRQAFVKVGEFLP